MQKVSPIQVLIYAGPGTGEISRLETHLCLRRMLPNFSVRWVLPSELIETDWHRDTRLLVIPGGQDLPYCESLEGLGTDSIRTYVSNGGSYLGICAGAYFACNEIEFERGTPCEVIGKRKLQLFPGRAIGQALNPGTFNYADFASADLARLNLSSSKEPVSVYFEGGCYFESTTDKALPLADYADLRDQPPAILSCCFGNGRVVLSGVHPEFSPHTVGSIRPALGALLESFERQRMSLLATMFEELGFNTKEIETHA